MFPANTDDSGRTIPDESEQIQKSMKVVDDYLRERDCANSEDMLTIHELVMRCGDDKHRMAYHRLRDCRQKTNLSGVAILGRRLRGQAVAEILRV
jgi:hypothetical protein